MVKIQDTQLYQDLTEGSRDAAYCAMIFIGRRGGPAIAGNPDDMEALCANRKPLCEWLFAQPDWQQIAADYVDFQYLWSPIYRD
ncbi:MAG: hypothetical protein GY803_30125 [Chloroflexi bacterium]|nr:hypothetical protein [Chloroflexota bacterium]